MVSPSPKKVCNNGGDKSPSPEPFKEPEGLVTIELHNNFKKHEVPTMPTKDVDQRKKKVLKILLLLFFINITVLGALLYINEESDFFKPNFSNDRTKDVLNQELVQNLISINDLIKKCVLTKPLKICCILFGDTNVKFYEFCNENNVQSSVRKRRNTKSNTVQNHKLPDNQDNQYNNHYPSNTENVFNYDNFNDQYDDFIYYEDEQYPYGYQFPYPDSNDHYNRAAYQKNALDNAPGTHLPKEHNEKTLPTDSKNVEFNQQSNKHFNNVNKPSNKNADKIEVNQKRISNPTDHLKMSLGSNQMESLSKSKEAGYTAMSEAENDANKFVVPIPISKIKNTENPQVASPGPKNGEGVPKNQNTLNMQNEGLAPTDLVLKNTDNSQIPNNKDKSSNSQNKIELMSSQDLKEKTKVDPGAQDSPVNSVKHVFLNEHLIAESESIPRDHKTENYVSQPSKNEENQQNLETFLKSQHVGAPYLPYIPTLKKLQNPDPAFHPIEKDSQSDNLALLAIPNDKYEGSSPLSINIPLDDVLRKNTDSLQEDELTKITRDENKENAKDMTVTSRNENTEIESNVAKQVKELIENSRDELNIDKNGRSSQKSEGPSTIMDLQSSQQTMYNPCFNVPNQYLTVGTPFDNSQVLKIVPSSSHRFPQLLVNPPVYSYIQSPFIMPPQSINPQIQTGSIQVSGPGGQFYICNPIGTTNNNVVTNNIAGLSGVEVRRDSINLDGLLGSLEASERHKNKSRSVDISCPVGYEACSDGSKCIPFFHICDNEVHCNDASDEEICSCKERVGTLRACDGYFDCPEGQDEVKCFGCDEDEFSCDDWSKTRKSTCIPIEQRCDSIIQCTITGKDEEDCSILTDNINEQPLNTISNSVGFLHRNYKGKWFPTCFGTEKWAIDVCKVESGPTILSPKPHMMVTTNEYNGYFINILPDGQVSLVKTCVQDRATYIECPPLYCGMRISIKNPYRQHEVDISAENMLNELERASNNAVPHDEDTRMNKEDNMVGNSRVVGGKPSQPAAWPWLVSIYKNGIFHCGGVLISELWVVTASHCVDRYWLYYYEIQAGMLRRFSYSPMEQHRWATVVIANTLYDRSSLKNDIALMKLSAPVRFNRYVRPICLPSEFTAGRNFASGPSPGTICTTVGWGATMEHGSDPDHMREVEVPILSHCKHSEDFGEEDICAGLSEGGKDACQGDSGGPLMCRNPNNPSQWYLAGIVSHGEGCARPDEPGVYTNVGKFVGWIVENMAEETFVSLLPLQHCPGYVCKKTNNCLPKKHQCDKIVDCLLADDEQNCQSFPNLFTFRGRESVNDEGSILGVELSDSDNKNQSKESVENNNSTKHSNISEPNNNYFTCKSLLQLVPLSKKCNKRVDCDDGTDEAGCRCADYVENRNPKAICDGITDCYDQTDEKCGECNVDEYHCRQSKKCIEITKRCDGIPDCAKHEDEWDCVALTDGKNITFDSDLRPKFQMIGIVTVNNRGIWRPLCQNTSEKAATIVTNVCYVLGFQDYLSFHELQIEDNPINTREGSPETVTNKTCSGLFVRCSNVSLDSSIHSIYLNNVTDEVELYTSPWNAVIYSDGKYRCMGAILNSRWIVTSVNCFEGITILNKYYVAVLLGKGKATLQVKGPHEQTLRIVESKKISDTDIILLKTENNIEFSRYIKDLSLNIRRDGRRIEKCVAIGLHNSKAKYEFLRPIENCEIGRRCFEATLKTNCTDFSPWSGSIICDSGNGWYPAAVFSETRGLCGLSSVVKYTSIPFNKYHIFTAMGNTSPNVNAPECNGFRCALGECISKNETCNGIENCSGGEDEEWDLCYENERSCHLTGDCLCHPTELKCKNKRCIPKSKFCDRNDDCGDLSDEPDVCNCEAYLELTNPDKICDGIIHCMDRSDEDPKICPCPLKGFQCISTDECIANEMVCDGYEDCPNGEDEKLCFNIVTENNETSNAGEMITRTGGIWHSGCFNKTYTTEELNKLCYDLGFDGDTSYHLELPTNVNPVAMRPLFESFNVVWIRREANSTFRLGLRTGNEPRVSFVPDVNCFKLFLACL